MYCKELKLPEKNQNNTEFLIQFNKYIDSETPNNPSCEYVQTRITLYITGPLTGNVCSEGFVYLVTASVLVAVCFWVRFTFILFSNSRIRSIKRFYAFFFLSLKRVQWLWSSSRYHGGSASGVSCGILGLHTAE